MRTLMVWLLLVGSLLITAPSQAAQISWVSAIPADDPAQNDAGFVTLLESAGHTVTRMFVGNNLAPTADQLVQLNASDLVIVGRAINSGSFDGGRERVWNEQIIKPLISMSAYTTRRSRMGWQSGENVPDSGATPLVAANPAHPVFNGISFAGDGMTMANNYNVMIDRGTSTIRDPLVGGTIIATNPAITGGTGIAIAEWPAGAMVAVDGATPNQTLAGRRYFFAGGSRETGGAVTNAGKMDLTDDGQRLFLNTVSYALIPEPSTWALSVIGLSLLLLVAKARLTTLPRQNSRS